MGTRGVRFYSAVLCAALFITSCGRNSDFIYHDLQLPKPYFSTTHQLKELQGERQVDVLFIVDNSGSMSSYQQALASNIDSFVKQFFSGGVLEWRMGLISTDPVNSPYIGLVPGTELDFRSTDAMNRFRAAVGRLGLNGDGTERTFTPLMKWLNEYPKFLRPQAILALVMVTDAPEQSMVPSANVLAFLTKVKGSLSKVVSYGVFAAADFGCRSDEGAWNYAGSPYEGLIAATNGKTYPLCQAFGPHLADMGKDLVSRVNRPEIQLTSRPRVETLKVIHRGVELLGGPEEEKGVWSYDFPKNRIVFHNMDFAPNDNEQVEIRYEIGG